MSDAPGPTSVADQPRYHALRKIADGAWPRFSPARGAAGFKRLVVLKRIRPTLWADDQFRQMLIARLPARTPPLEPVEVLDRQAGDRYFTVLELVDGDLARCAKRGADPPPASEPVRPPRRRGLPFLAYAHQRTQAGADGHLHRDVCPNNVLVSQHAEVKLADFDR